MSHPYMDAHTHVHARWHLQVFNQGMSDDDSEGENIMTLDQLQVRYGAV